MQKQNKSKSLLLITIIILTILLLPITACQSTKYEDKLLGTWVYSSGGTTIMFTFEKEDGVYKAGRATRTSYSNSPSIMLYESFSASDSYITLKPVQNGNQIKYSYSLKNGYLYLDGREYEKWNS